MRPACSLPPKGGSRAISMILVVLMLSTGCAATTSRTTDDATTTTRVKIALLNDARVGGLRLEVKTFQGVVTLSGTVTSQADVQAAIAAARTIQGVREVKSELKIVPGLRSIRASAVQSERYAKHENPSGCA